MSADASRTLIGDDEHGWSDTAVFNFEGGCYAKMIRLSPEAEPEIYATTKRFGTVLENVVIDPETRELDLDDASLAENSRGAYPIDFIPNASAENMGPVPKNVIMLTADAFGVLPPIARLTPDQAMYHFLSGYTAKVAGTEIGVTEPEATFSTCFGAPFMPRHPSVYGNLLKERIAKGGVDCWLVNTGWTGGKYGIGQPHADQGDPRAAQRRARRQPQRCRVPQGSEFRLRGAGQRAGRRQPRSSTRARPGPTRPTTTRPRPSWWPCSSTTSPSSRTHVDEGVREAAPRAGGHKHATHPGDRDHGLTPSHSQPLSRERAGEAGALLFFYAYKETTNDDVTTNRGSGRTTTRSAGSARACSPAPCPRAEWTHEAHLATCAGCSSSAPTSLPERDLPDLIRRYNESVGGVNDDTEGYHETITQVLHPALRGAWRGREGRALAERVNALLLAPEGRRDWPLRFYSRERLFSMEARLGWVEPDLAPFWVTVTGLSRDDHEDAPQVGVQAVADRHVDQPVLSADRNRRFRALLCKGKQAGSLAAAQDNREHVVHLRS